MDNKKCNKCLQEKDPGFFKKSKNRYGLWYLGNVCRLCRQVQAKRYRDTHIQYKTEQRIRNNEYRKRNRQWLIDYKEDKPCADCNIKYPHYVMDFDHLNPLLKRMNVSALKNGTSNIETIKDEIAKCEIVCSNCHRIRTHKEKFNG